MGLELISSLLKVGAVFVLLFITLRLLGTWFGTRGSALGRVRSAKPGLEKIEELRLGRGSSVVTVRVGDKVLLLGVTEAHVEQLADVSDAYPPVDELGDAPTSPSPLEAAIDLLRHRHEV